MNYLVTPFTRNREGKNLVAPHGKKNFVTPFGHVKNFVTPESPTPTTPYFMTIASYSYTVLQIYTCHFSYAALPLASLTAKM